MPAFRKKGETALLECKYELKKRHHFKMQHHGQSAEEEEEAAEDRDEAGHRDELPESEEDDILFHRDQPRRRRPQSQSQRQRSRRGGEGQRRRQVEEFAEEKFYETSEALYSVKWYKDNEEFYRYLPKSNPPQHSYRVEGIRVDVSIRFQGIVNVLPSFHPL